MGSREAVERKFANPARGVVEIDVDLAIEHGAGFVDHANVLRAIKNGDIPNRALALANAIEAEEELFKRNAPIEAILQWFR